MYNKDELDPIIASLLEQYVEDFIKILENPSLPTLIRVKLYELLSSLIQLDNTSICMQMFHCKVTSVMVADYKRYEDNTNMLILLNGAVKSILTCKVSNELSDQILFE